MIVLDVIKLAGELDTLMNRLDRFQRAYKIAVYTILASRNGVAVLQTRVGFIGLQLAPAIDPAVVREA